MNRSEHPSRAGRFTALATLAASAGLFFSALTGIASIDPSANAATRTMDQAPALHDISLDQKREQMESRRDCPWKHGRDGKRSGVTS